LNAAKKPNVSRRDFFGLAGAGLFFVALFTWALSLLRSLRPSVLPERSARFKIGTPDQFSPGTVTEFPRHKAIVFADETGLHAISTICTHLGCVVQWNKNGFHCPCHGSKFDVDGRVIGGPAPKGLPWLYIEQLPSGRLAVDVSSYVPQGTKFHLPEEA